jgi:P4 family phage/plasmid primase-like protien
MKMDIGTGNLMNVAEQILDENAIFWTGINFYMYWNGVYRLMPEEKIKKLVMDKLAGGYTRNKAKEIIEIFKVQHYIESSHLNPKKFINLKNGIFDLSNKKLLKHSGNYLSTIQLPIEYNPDAQCPRWRQFLDEVFEKDQERSSFLQQIFGYCVTKSIEHQVAFFFLGPGSTGKSTSARILKEIVGKENTSAISLEQLRNNHYVAELYGKQLNIVLETKKGSVVDDAMFKAIVSGDPIQADIKFKPPFMFEPFCKMIYVTNHMPRVMDTSDAFYRRVVIVRFDKQFRKGKEEDPYLLAKLKEEKDGIFIWALEGLEKLEKQGYFKLPKQITDEVEKYRKDNTHVIKFIEEKCEISVNSLVGKDELFVCYLEWASENGYDALGKIQFGQQLQQIFREIKDDRKSDVRCWSGVRLTK